MGACTGQERSPWLKDQFAEYSSLGVQGPETRQRRSDPTSLAFQRGCKRSLAIRGSLSPWGQQSFADKRMMTEVSGAASPASFKVGWACKKGLKPGSPNQDDFCVLCTDGAAIYGIFDGHGPHGHAVANFVQFSLAYAFVEHPRFQDDPREALCGAFSQTQDQCVKSHAMGSFDCSMSGTTATLAMCRDDLLYLAHVGDSRAVLAKSLNGKLESEDLTNDHKPTCEGERHRVEAAGGEVRQLEGDEPHRVFVQGRMYPGLAMTRAFGDTIGTSAGVTSSPEVNVLKVEEDWCFMLLCSDGVWEFITSQEAVDIIGRFPAADAHKAAEALAGEAWTRWMQEEGNIVDDITVVCAWFGHN